MNLVWLSLWKGRCLVERSRRAIIDKGEEKITLGEEGLFSRSKRKKLACASKELSL